MLDVLYVQGGGPCAQLALTQCLQSVDGEVVIEVREKERMWVFSVPFFLSTLRTTLQGESCVPMHPMHATKTQGDGWGCGVCGYPPSR